MGSGIGWRAFRSVPIVVYEVTIPEEEGFGNCAAAQQRRKRGGLALQG
jgi:hypothetical protein